jgi:hypothetical protein
MFDSPWPRQHLKHASKKHKGGMKRVGVLFGISINREPRSAVFPCEDNKHAHGPSKKRRNVAKTSFAICQTDADPTLPTHPTTNRSAMNYQVRRVGTKMVAHGFPQQHSKLVILSKMLEIQCKNMFGKLVNGPN